MDVCKLLYSASLFFFCAASQSHSAHVASTARGTPGSLLAGNPDPPVSPPGREEKFGVQAEIQFSFMPALSFPPRFQWHLCSLFWEWLLSAAAASRGTSCMASWWGPPKQQLLKNVRAFEISWYKQGYLVSVICC